MPYIYNEVTGQQINTDDVNGLVVYNEETKKATGEKYYFGDTTKSRNLLAIANTPLASTWDYMPKSSADIAQSVALDTMANGDALQLAKIVAGTIGGILGGGAFSFAGAGIGYLMVEAGAEIYDWISSAGDDPHTFWNKFTNNIGDLADDNSFQKFWSGVKVGQTFSEAGATQGLYQDWGDVIGEKGFAVGAGEVVGSLVRSAATIMAAGGLATSESGKALASKVGVIADVSLSSGTREASRLVGLGEDAYKGLGIGALHAVASGVTGATFVAGLPWVFSTHAKPIVDAVANSRLASIAATGTEFAAWGVMEDNLINIAEGREIEVDPMRVAAGFALGAGFSTILNALPKGKKPLQIEYHPRSEAIAIQKDNLLPYYTQLEKHYRPDELQAIGSRILKSDAATGFSGNSFENPVAFVARMQKEHFESKGSLLSDESAIGLYRRYGTQSPSMGKTWSDESLSAISIADASFKTSSGRSVSAAGKQFLNEKIQTLRNVGYIADEEAPQVANAIVSQALKDNKGSIGNFEIRKAFDKVMAGGMQ